MTDTTERNNTKSSIAAPKLTAAEVESNASPRLEAIGSEISNHLATIRQQLGNIDSRKLEIRRLLGEAEHLCDAGGFQKFREQFLSHLGRTQTYNFRAIVLGKKTVEGYRADERERKRRSRDKQKAALPGPVPEPSEQLDDQIEDSRPRKSNCLVLEKDASRSNGAAVGNSGTVPERSQPLTDKINSRPSIGGLVIQHEEGNAAPRAGGAAEYVLLKFAQYVTELDRITKNKPADHFYKTAVKSEVLARVGKRLASTAEMIEPDELPLSPDTDRFRSSNYVSDQYATVAPDGSLNGVPGRSRSPDEVLDGAPSE